MRGKRKVRDFSLRWNIVFQKSRRAAVCVLATLLLMNGVVSPAEAGDKITVSLQCLTTKVVLTCTKFDGGNCIRSTLTFDAGNGVHTVLPTEKIPQNFDVPTIADDISCETSNVTSKHKFAVAVIYSPGCSYDGCQAVRMYDLNGISVLTGEDSEIPDYFGKGATDLQDISDESLRGDQ